MLGIASRKPDTLLGWLSIETVAGDSETPTGRHLYLRRPRVSSSRFKSVAQRQFPDDGETGSYAGSYPGPEGRWWEIDAQRTSRLEGSKIDSLPAAPSFP